MLMTSSQNFVKENLFLSIMRFRRFFSFLQLYLFSTYRSSHKTRKVKFWNFSKKLEMFNCTSGTREVQSSWCLRPSLSLRVASSLLPPRHPLHSFSLPAFSPFFSFCLVLLKSSIFFFPTISASLSSLQPFLSSMLSFPFSLHEWKNFKKKSLMVSVRLEKLWIIAYDLPFYIMNTQEFS